jgi:hypothetical protein
MLRFLTIDTAIPSGLDGEAISRVQILFTATRNQELTSFRACPSGPLAANFL